MSGTEPLAAELGAIVGASHVIASRSGLLAYESDALPGYRRRPALAVFPGTRDETLQVMRVLARAGASFVPRGAGTGLSGGALADGVVLLGLQRLRRIIDLDPVRRTATVEPGVVNAALTAAAAPYGLHYAPDPSSQTACTIGGNVAENAGGPHCLKYGVTLNHVVGATVALPDGDVVTLRVPSSAEDGYDLLGAFVGSEGCFGVALDITVCLTPNPEAVRTLLADFTSIEDAARATSAIIASGIVPAACELMDHGTIAAVEASIYAAGYPPDAAAVLLVEVDGSAASVDEEAANIEEICRGQRARTVRSASDPMERARLWQGRKKAFGAMGRIAPHLFVQDAVVPRTQLASILVAIGEIGARHRVRICNVFHAGDGNLHPNIPYNGRDPDERARVHEAMREIMLMCIARGGSITGEHGVGLDKLAYMERLFSADTLDAMCRVRHVFDPGRRANPGKVVPVHSCREWNGAPGARAAVNSVSTANAISTARVAALPGLRVRAEAAFIEAVHEARTSGTTLYVAGARTRVGAPPPDVAVLDARASAGVIEYVPGDLTITIGAGTTLAALNEITAEHGQWCPLLPWGTDACTVGGVLATGTCGPAARTLGSPRDLALGITFVDGLGTLVSAGGRVVKNVAGFDLTRVLIGSWGSLGAISSASLRLRAIPAAQETWALAATSAHEDKLVALCRGPLAPIAIERLDGAFAASFGLEPEPHLLLWIAGNAAHVRASRDAVRSLGRAWELPLTTWVAVRARGQTRPPRAPASPSPAVAELNARLRRAFDPHGVFASAARPGALGPALA